MLMVAQECAPQQQAAAENQDLTICCSTARSSNEEGLLSLSAGYLCRVLSLHAKVNKHDDSPGWRDIPR